MGILALAELHVALFAFLLNFVWEFWQVPLYTDMPAVAHWEGVIVCTQATLGDVVITLLAFWAAAALVRSRAWIEQRNRRAALAFVAVGVAATVLLEWLATDALGRWSYAPSMPVLPVLGTGLAPLLQWLVLPPLVIWFGRRQLT